MLEDFIDMETIDRNTTMLKNLCLSGTVKIVCKDIVLAGCKKKGNKSRDESTSIRKNTQKISSRIVNYGSSSSRMEIDMDTGSININSPVDIGEESNDSLDSTSTTTVVPNLVMSTPKTKNRVKRNSNRLLSSNSFCDILTKSEDTASITFPSILENCDRSNKTL